MSVGKSAAPAAAAADVEFAKGQLVLYRTRDGAWVEAKVGPSCATPCLSFQTVSCDAEQRPARLCGASCRGSPQSMQGMAAYQLCI